MKGRVEWQIAEPGDEYAEWHLIVYIIKIKATEEVGRLAVTLIGSYIRSCHMGFGAGVLNATIEVDSSSARP